MSQVHTRSALSGSGSAFDSVEALQTVIDVLAMPVFVKDRDHRFVLVNEAMCRFMGRDRAALIGATDLDFVPAEQAAVFWQGDDRVFDSEEVNENEEKLSDGLGQVRTIVTRKSLARIGGAAFLVGVINDISAFREAEAHIRYLAFHDTLSGLANRTLLLQQMEMELSRFGRAGDTCLLLVDLDGFKQVNDAYGHGAGDELIVEFAKRLTGLVRSGDTVARLGGDEFAILVRESGEQPAEAIAQRVLDMARASFEVAGVWIFVSASIGIATAGRAETDPGELLRKADVALYSAKNSGRGCFRRYDELMDEGRAGRIELERDLRIAIEAGGGEIEVHFQPTYAAETITSVEALARWNHPTHGRLPPSRFIPLAEETGLILPLGDLVLDRSCAALASWPRVRLAFNASTAQLRDPGFARRAIGIAGARGIDPSRIEIEIVDAASLARDPTIALNLKQLRSSGMRIALDDFGVGYSSLTYLQRLNVDRIKIDQSFIRHLGKNAEATPIVSALIHIARSFGLAVTAEGVETAEQQQILTGIGCEDLQGYLLGPPIPAEAMSRLLAADLWQRETRNRMRLVNEGFGPGEGI